MIAPWHAIKTFAFLKIDSKSSKDGFLTSIILFLILLIKILSIKCLEDSSSSLSIKLFDTNPVEINKDFFCAIELIKLEKFS